jgi:hypothetical protein
MGPIALFDKSFLQSLSLDESVFFDHFFFPVICPLFYVETLADLEKSVREGRTPEQEVGIIADKVPEMSGGPCAYHLDLGAHVLFGANVPMDGRIPTSGGRPVKVDGKAGFVHSVPPEAEAFDRWQKREFLYVEREFARGWRAALNGVDLVTIAAGMRAMGVTPQACKSLEDARRLVDCFFERSGETVADQIKLALIAFGVPLQYERLVLARWRSQGSPPLARFAPYAAHIIAVELFFQIALGADLIGTARVSNRTDIGYLFYAPFSHMFVSSDHLHRRCAAYFLRPDQSFVWGPDLKADLNRLMNYYASRPEEEKEQGLMRLAPTPPPDDKGLTVQLWDRHLIASWRNDLAGRGKARNTEQDAKLVEHINRVSDAPALPADAVDFKPTDTEFVHLTRNISRRKGSWWQVPKHLKG